MYCMKSVCHEAKYLDDEQGRIYSQRQPGWQAEVKNALSVRLTLCVKTIFAFGKQRVAVLCVAIVIAVVLV